MRRSLFWLLDHYPETGESVANLHETALEQAAAADRLGFTSLWLAEHHFWSFSTVPNPAVLLAAIAQRTRRIRLGPATSVLPLRHPIHVAEDYALVDALSGGRLNMGVGSGSRPNEFTEFGVDFEERKDLYTEHLASLRERWGAAARGEAGPESLNVAPVQSPAPPIYVATMNEKIALQVGLAGDSMLTLVPPSAASLTELVARLRAHARGLRQAGRETKAESVVMMFAHIADTEAEVRATVIPALSRLIFSMTGTELPDAEALYEMMRENAIGLFGTPSEVREQSHRLANIGVNHIAFISRFGGMPKEAALRSLRYLAPTASVTGHESPTKRK